MPCTKEHRECYCGKDDCSGDYLTCTSSYYTKLTKLKELDLSEHKCCQINLNGEIPDVKNCFGGEGHTHKNIIDEANIKELLKFLDDERVRKKIISIIVEDISENGILNTLLPNVDEIKIPLNRNKKE